MDNPQVNRPLAMKKRFGHSSVLPTTYPISSTSSNHWHHYHPPGIQTSAHSGGTTIWPSSVAGDSFAHHGHLPYTISGEDHNSNPLLQILRGRNSGRNSVLSFYDSHKLKENYKNLLLLSIGTMSQIPTSDGNSGHLDIASQGSRSNGFTANHFPGNTGTSSASRFWDSATGGQFSVKWVSHEKSSLCLVVWSQLLFWAPFCCLIRSSLGYLHASLISSSLSFFM